MSDSPFHPFGALIPPATLCLRADTGESSALFEMARHLNERCHTQIRVGFVNAEECPDGRAYAYMSMGDLPEEIEGEVLQRFPLAGYMSDAYRQEINRRRLFGARP